MNKEDVGVCDSVKRQSNSFETNKSTTDCVFVIDGEEVRAHKLILTCCSPVFEKMFYGKMACDTIFITDISFEDFSLMLQFIYTNEITIKSVLQAWSLFYIAHKYLIGDFGEFCINYIEQNLDINNLVLNYEYAEMYGVERLQKVCLSDVSDYVRGIFSKNCDYHMKSSSLMTILQQKTLNISNSELIKGVLNWAVSECDINNYSISPENIIHLLSSTHIIQYLVDLDFNSNFTSDTTLIKKCCNLLKDLRDVESPTKHYLKKPWCIFCKCRQTYKIAGRMEMRERDVLISNISVNRDTLLYGLVIATENEPIGKKQNEYKGVIQIEITDIDNSEVISQTFFSKSFLYEAPVYVPMWDVVYLETSKIYSIKIRYKNLDCLTETGTSKSSVLCNYMSSKLVDERRNLVISFDEMDGSVIKGASYYPA